MTSLGRQFFNINLTDQFDTRNDNGSYSTIVLKNWFANLMIFA